MNAESIITVSAAVVALVQLSKWAGLKDSFGPLVVIAISAAGVLVYIFGSDHWPPLRTDTWPIFAGWIAVATSAAGVFGFTRAAVGAVTAAKPPPFNGAGSEPTADSVTVIADQVMGLTMSERERLEREVTQRHADEIKAAQLDDAVRAEGRV